MSEQPFEIAARHYHGVKELAGSTHEERVKFLSEAIRRVNPVTDAAKWTAIFDCYLICLDHDERECLRRVALAPGPERDRAIEVFQSVEQTLRKRREERRPK